MTSPTRTAIIRTIASSLCFDADPPAMRSLDRARVAAGQITDALVEAGALPAALGPVTTNGDGAAEFRLPVEVA